MNDILHTIQEALTEAGIYTWRIQQNEVTSAELFFIRRRLDMRRMKETVKYPVTVYHAFTKDGKAYLGSSETTILPAQSKEEILTALREADYAASFVANPTYTLPEKLVREPVEMPSDLSALPVEAAAMRMAETLFAADTDSRGFINSAEIFAVKTSSHLLTSWGTDAAYTKYGVRGEFVVQCKEPEDVEIYHNFAYDSLQCGALTALAKNALAQVADRAAAKMALPSGTYRLILSDKHLEELLSYFTSRTSVQMVYPGYSPWKVGSDVQGTLDGGEPIQLTLHATLPFSAEGIPMQDRTVIENGTVCLLHGDARLSSYLGVPATGTYRAMQCGNGTVSFASMKEEPYLYPVTFSDFQMDPMNGHFGGEIRLAYYFDGEQTHIITGGSVNGSITDCAGQLRFSLERYDSESYHGPFAVSIPNVKVAGTV